MNRIASVARVRHPHAEFSTVSDEVQGIRRRLAHLVVLGDIEGEAPHRTVNFVRRGDPGEAYGRRGGALGLKWRDDQWAQLSFHGDSVTEQELRDCLDKEKWMIHVSRAVSHLAGILNDPAADLPDDKEIGRDCNWLSPYSGGWWIPWMLPEWIKHERTVLCVRDIRLPAVED